MAALSPRRGREEFVRLLHRELALPAFFDAADTALQRAMPYDGACWLSLDPATLLPTSHFTREFNLSHLMQLAANEFLEDDVNKFAALARATRPVRTMWQATHGNFASSPRYTRLLAPGGLCGDELRAVFLDGESVWGCVVLHRRQGRFEDRDVAFVADVAGYVGEGIRRAITATALRADEGPDQPGLVIVRSDGSVDSLTPAARRLLDGMLDPTGHPGGIPLIVASVAHRARLAAAGETEEVARARVPLRSGGWLVLDGCLVDGGPGDRVAVILQAATSPEIAALIAEAHGLSKREREVTRLVLYGLATREIAHALGVSEYTVQDHLKAIFEKVGVRSRRELTAQLFQQHYAPRLERGAPVGPRGWFAEEPHAAQPALTKH
jgi:DNA-binding CsgD family transcriptional regulator